MKFKLIVISITVIFVIALFVGGYSLYDRGRPAPWLVKEKLFDGVTYQRVVHESPAVGDRNMHFNRHQKEITPASWSHLQILMGRFSTELGYHFPIPAGVRCTDCGEWRRVFPMVVEQCGRSLSSSRRSGMILLGFSASNGNVYWNGENGSGYRHRAHVVYQPSEWVVLYKPA